MGKAEIKEKYILQMDVSKFFPNWHRMTKKEQQEWKKKFAAMEKRRREGLA